MQKQSRIQLGLHHQAHSVPDWCKAFDDKYHKGDVGGVEAGLGTFLQASWALSETDRGHAVGFYYLSLAVFDCPINTQFLLLKSELLHKSVFPANNLNSREVWIGWKSKVFLAILSLSPFTSGRPWRHCSHMQAVVIPSWKLLFALQCIGDIFPHPACEAATFGCITFSGVNVSWFI